MRSWFSVVNVRRMLMAKHDLVDRFGHEINQAETVIFFLLVKSFSGKLLMKLEGRLAREEHGSLLDASANSVLKR